MVLTGSICMLPVTSRLRVRDVTSLPLWVCCFMTFFAVGTTDPVTRNRLTYAFLLLREAQRHGGQGWRNYDCLFRQQAAIDPTLLWTMKHLSLKETTILGRHPVGQGRNLL